jgi:hypothetical protein
VKGGKLIFTLIIGTMVFLIGSSCSVSDSTKFKEIAVPDSGITFTFPESWRELADKEPYDLQCTNGNAYASVFAFRAIDLSENTTPLDIFEMQKEDLFSRRTNVKKISETEDYLSDDARIRSELYSAEKDELKNYYYCNVIDLAGDTGAFAWLIFTAVPSYADRNLDTWKQIVKSARWSGE